MPDETASFPNRLPIAPGVGFKAQHFQSILADPGPVEWLEVHAENYLGDGGRPLAQLQHLSEKFPISVHGVGLSIGGEAPLDVEHLNRVQHLCQWLGPACFSEHLAWSTHDGAFLNDLLPLPYTRKTLEQVKSHITQVQDTLRRQILLENPSTYLAFAESDMSEVEFLSEVASGSGCGLLLDINNVFVSASNQQTDPQDYIDSFPISAVCELHLGGHSRDLDDQGLPLLIDDHASEITDEVLDVFSRTLERTGPLPTLIEWDNNVPDWSVLVAEAGRVADALECTQT